MRKAVGSVGPPSSTYCPAFAIHRGSVFGWSISGFERAAATRTALFSYEPSRDSR